MLFFDFDFFAAFDIGSDMTLDIEKPHTILGAGAFGVVVLGKLTNYNNGDEYTTDVAVKMLKGKTRIHCIVFIRQSGPSPRGVGM